ncbi:response regulator [Pedobacter sp. L105]|uniref:response regulator n=1 Tax=Pedobacter sp. L105 TaxID=1641871 RepID=UPI00131AF626|nr:response regulator [Pedobacter sp. L105]
MKKVIVQDADCDLLETITIVLQEGEYTVLPLLLCKDIISQIPIFNPQLVVLDFRLYGEECTHLCKLIKKDFPDLPVIAMSCNSNIENEYQDAGFDNFIIKPFDIEHLLDVLLQY